MNRRNGGPIGLTLTRQRNLAATLRCVLGGSTFEANICLNFARAVLQLAVEKISAKVHEMHASNDTDRTTDRTVCPGWRHPKQACVPEKKCRHSEVSGASLQCRCRRK